jgi:hypothetical protein
VKYLRGIADRSSAGIPWDADAPMYTWSTSRLTRAQLTAMFRADSRTNVGDLLKLDLRRRGVSGRLYAVVLYGSAGTKTVSGDVFRSVYNASGRPARCRCRAICSTRSRFPEGTLGQSSRRRKASTPPSSTSATHTALQAMNAAGGGASAKNGFARIASAFLPALMSSTAGGSRP